MKPRELIFKTHVPYTRQVAEVYGARLYQVPQDIDEIDFVDIEDGCPLPKKPRTIAFAKYRIAKNNVPRTSVLLEIKRLHLRPATFHEFATFLQYYPELPSLRSLVCFGSHGQVRERPVLLTVVYEHGNQSLYFDNINREWSRGTNVLCVLEQH